MISWGQPDTATQAIVAGLRPVTRAVYDGLLPELQAMAMTVSGVTSHDILQRTRDRLAAVPEGTATWTQTRKLIAADLAPDLGAEAPRRAELLLRAVVFRAGATAHYRNLMEMIDVFPNWKYVTHGDGRVRPEHAALDGKIFPAGHPIWQRIFPPWGWGCRCQVIGILELDATDVAVEDENKLPENRTLYSMEETDVILRHERLPGGQSLGTEGTYTSPAKSGLKLWTPEELRERYDAATWSTFSTWARQTPTRPDGPTVWEWIAGEDPSLALDGPFKRVPLGKVADEVHSRKSPVSKACDLSRLNGTVHEYALHALRLVDKVHDDGLLKPSVFTHHVDPKYEGTYRPGHIGVREDTAFPLTTVLHETGHRLDSEAFGGKGVPASDFQNSDWGKFAAKLSSLAKRRINAAPLEQKDKTYLLSPREIMARAYSQFIVLESGDETASLELGRLPSHLLYDDGEYKMIKRFFKRELQKKKWIKHSLFG